MDYNKIDALIAFTLVMKSSHHEWNMIAPSYLEEKANAFLGTTKGKPITDPMTKAAFSIWKELWSEGHGLESLFALAYKIYEGKMFTSSVPSPEELVGIYRECLGDPDEIHPAEGSMKQVHVVLRQYIDGYRIRYKREYELIGLGI